MARRVIGRSNNVDRQVQVKSTKPYVKKAIYGVYNVSSNESIKTVSKFVSELCGADPINCFLVKTRNADETNPSQSISFRICIDAQFSTKVRDPLAWVNGIVIKPWKFKPKPRASQANPLPDHSQA